MTLQPGPPGSLLQFDFTKPPAVPRDAATLVLLRDAADGIEVFCVERNRKSGFMAGALVFPGGKVDEGDRGGEDLHAGNAGVRPTGGT